MDYNTMLAGLRELVDNPTPRVPVGLCLDVSSSMYGQPIEELNAGLRQFLDELRKDELTCTSAETAVVTFGSSAQCVADFATADQIQVEPLEANGLTYMGEGLTMALDLLEQRKERYKAAGVDYYQPILVVMSDGCPNGDPKVLREAAQRICQMVEARRLTVVAVGIGEGADMEQLRRISGRKAVRLQGLQFREFFAWLSRSVSVVSDSIPGAEPEPDLAELQALAAQPWPEDAL